MNKFFWKHVIKNCGCFLLIMLLAYCFLFSPISSSLTIFFPVFIQDLYYVYFTEINLLVLIVIMLVVLYRLSLPFIRQIAAIHSALDKPSKEMDLFPETKEIIHQIDDLKEKLNHQALQTKEAQKLKKQRILYLAHDLKTPLTSLVGYFHVLQDDLAFKKEDAYYLQIMERKLMRMEALREQFALLLESDQISFHPEVMDISELLQTICQDSQIEAEKNKLTFQLACEPAFIYADLQQMLRLCTNLVRNCIAYSDPESIIAVTVKKQNKKVFLLFENECQDLKNQKADDLFVPFYRINGSRSSEEGAGLGLSIVQSIVQMHHGTLQASIENTHLQIQIELDGEKDESNLL